MTTTAPFLSGDLALESVLAALSVASGRSHFDAPSSAALTRAFQIGWIDQDGLLTQAGYRLLSALGEAVNVDEQHASAA